MANDWRRGTVIELQEAGILRVEDGNHGEKRPRPEEFDESGISFIRAADMDNGRVLFGKASKINAVARRRITKGIGAPGDVLLSHKGTVGKVALVPDDAPPFVCSPQTTFWRVLDAKVLDRQYLHAFLRSPAFHQQLSARAGETDMAPYVSLTSQRALVVSFPRIEQQRAIANILGTLDHKIELNRGMNETLEAMGRALFRSWFVAHSESGSASEKLVSELAAAGLLQVGDGYRAKNDELAREGMPFARAGNIDNGFDFSGADLLGFPGVKRASDKVSRPYDIVFTSKGTIGRFAFVDPVMSPFVYSPQLCFWRSTDQEALNPFVLFHWTRSRWFLDQVDRVKGQTDMAEYVSLRDQRAMVLSLPAASAQREVGMHLEGLQRLVWNNERQSRSLTMLRHELLPRLLSGELSVANAEGAVGAMA